MTLVKPLFNVGFLSFFPEGVDGMRARIRKQEVGFRSSDANELVSFILLSLEETLEETLGLTPACRCSVWGMLRMHKPHGATRTTYKYVV